MLGSQKRENIIKMPFVVAPFFFVRNASLTVPNTKDKILSFDDTQFLE